MILRKKHIKPERIRKPRGISIKPGQMTPIEYIMTVINDPKTDKARRDNLAMFAAPYIDAKMRPLRHKSTRTKKEKTPGKKFVLAKKAQNGHAKTQWNSDLQ